MIESRFNHSLLRKSLVSILLGLATMTLAPLVTSFTWAVALTILGIYLMVIIGWLCWLKSVSIWQDQIEVRHPFLPFVRHTYWFREFDYCRVEQERKWKTVQETLYLIRNGKREVTISTATYANYEELKLAVAAIGQNFQNTSDVRAVESVFAKGHLASVLAILAFVLLGIAIPIVEYLEEGQVAMKSIGLGTVVAVFFLVCFVGYFFPYKRLVVWRGRLEVQRLLWPFRVCSYLVSDLDVSLEVVTPTQFGERELSLWLFRNGKLEVRIPQAIYANYDALLNAMKIVPHDTVVLSPVKKLRYYLGKTLEI